MLSLAKELTYHRHDLTYLLHKQKVKIVGNV